MIIQYDRNPSLSIDEKIQSLIESIQMALNELNDEAAPIIKAIQMLSKDTAVTAKVERVVNGVKITITDINGTTEEIVYEAIEDVIFNQNGSFTFVFPDGRTYTSASLIGPAGPQGERGPQGLPGPQGVPGEVGETGNGIADAKLNSDYTLTITFTDGTSYTTPSIRGLQGEQGIQGIQGVRGERGETGSKGDTGEAAGFGTPTASVDSNVGTPSVVVTASGADTAKVFDFAFHNLKGQQGEQGIRGIQGPKGDTFTYDDLTAAQKAEIKANLQSFYTKGESNYVTTLASETTIPIGISGFRATDILFVDINGLDLIENEDYTISGTNIVLDTPITTAGTIVHFVSLRAIEITQQDYSALKGDPGDVSDVLVDGTSVVDQTGSANIILSNILLDYCHPVGTTYKTIDPNFDPNISWGGTWEKLPEGYVLLSGSSNGTYKVGEDSSKPSGYKEYGENTHTLIADELPSHTHGNKSLTGYLTMRRGGTNNTQNMWAGGIASVQTNSEGNSYNLNYASSQNKSDRININASHEHNSVGLNQAHNIMQKSIAVYCWIRTL